MIVLDTATWIWLASSPGQLSDSARRALDDHPQRRVSAISAWEIGMLVAKGRISLDRTVDQWVGAALSDLAVSPIPVDHRIGVLATQLPGDPPADPADRMIVATTLVLDCVLVTPDQALREYRFCPTVW